jgi:GxxExxY protein
MEEIGREVVDVAIHVHKALRPGMLESAYGTCMAYELETRGIRVERQVLMSLTYRGLELESG